VWNVLTGECERKLNLIHEFDDFYDGDSEDDIVSCLRSLPCLLHENLFFPSVGRLISVPCQMDFKLSQFQMMEFYVCGMCSRENVNVS
jgi:hypothetical protein